MWELCDSKVVGGFMKKGVKFIEHWISQISGKMLGIGIEEPSILEEVMKNDSILECNLLESISLEENGKGRTKYLPIKKLRKRFKKKQTEYLLMKDTVIRFYLHRIIKDSIYLIKKEIVIYGIPDMEELELLKKRYQRYKVEMKSEKEGKEWILIINVEHAKNNRWKDFIHFPFDYLYHLMDLASEMLIR